MADLTATPSVFETLPDTMYLIETISSAATSLKLNYVPLAIAGGILILDEGTTREERVSFGSVTDNGDSTATFGSLRRGLAYGGGTAYAASGTTAYEHTGNSSTARLVIAHEYLNKTSFIDVARTFSALQTFSAGITMSGTTIPFQNLPVTTTQRDAMTPSNGAQVYNSTTGQTNWYEGGAWVANAAGGSLANGSTTVAGKFEEATVAEQGAATATGGTGARLVLAAANLIKTSAGAADENKVVVMNAAGVVDVSAGGTGVRNPTAGSVYIGAGSSAMTAVAPSTSGNVLKSDGSTWVSGTVTSTAPRTAYISGALSTTLTNPTADTAFDTHTTTVSANVIDATSGYRFEAAFTGTIAAGNLELGVMLGGARVVAALFNDGNQFTLSGFIAGTAVASASAAVHGMATGLHNTTPSAGIQFGHYATANFATNGALALALFAKFSSSNGGNNVTCTMCHFSRLSSVAF